MKRAIIAVPAFLVIVIAILLVAPGFIDWGAHKSKIEDQFQKATGHEVALNGDVELAILPFPRLMIEDLEVKAPPGSVSETLASLKRLDVHIALVPLLRGEIPVDSIKLVEPQIYLEITKDGKLNWITEKIEKSISAAHGQKSAKDPSENKNNKLVGAISLKNVEIKNGSFHFANRQKGSETSLENINATLKADTLLGPYKTEGGFSFDGFDINIKGGAGRYSPDTRSIVPKLKLTVKPADVSIEYTGVVSFEDKLEIQGETDIQSANIAASLEAMGQTRPKNLEFSLAAKGLLTASQEEMAYKNLILKIGPYEYNGEITGQLSPLRIAAALKQTGKAGRGTDLWLPSSLNADIILAMEPGLITLKQSILVLNDMTIGLSGSYVQGTKNRRPRVSVNAVASRIDLASFQPETVAPSDKSQTKMEAATKQSKANPKDLSKKLALPVDTDFDITVKELTLKEYSLKGFDIKGALRGSKLSLDKLAVQDVEGAKFYLSGNIADTQNLSGIDMKISGKARDIKALAASLGTDTSTWPQALKKTEILAALKGSAEKLALTGNIEAMGGELITEGDVLNPLEVPKLENLSLQVRHGNMAGLIKNFNPEFSSSPALEKPVNIFAVVNQDGKTYQLSDIKGTLAGTATQGTATIDLSAEKPSLNGKLQFGDLVLDGPSGSRSAGSSGTGAAKKAPGGAAGASGEGDVRWSREAINTVWMHAMNADLDIVAKSITSGKWHLVNPSLKAKLNDGELNISNLHAGLFGGQVTMTSKIKAPENPRQPVSMESTSQVRDVSIEQLSQALTGSKVVKGKGLISMDTELSSVGLSPAALIYDLTGKGTISGRDLVLEGYDLTHFAAAMSDDTKLGRNVEQIWQGASAGGRTAFDTLDGNFTLSEGVINIARLDLDSQETAVAARGNVNLPRWWIDMQALITMKPPYDIPPYTIPIEGPLDDPRAVTTNILSDFIARKLERKAGKELNKLLGKMLDVPEQQPAPQPQPQPEQVTPSGGEATQQPTPQQQPQELNTEEVIRGVIDLFQ